MKSFLLLCAFFFTSATADFVLDTDGNPLENGGTYYVVAPANCGGIEHAVASGNNETCPLTVVQNQDQSCKGFPITISNPSFILYISEGLNVNIGFTFRPSPPCATTSEWSVVRDPSLPPEALAVKLNNNSDNNNYDDVVISGLFKIRRLPVHFITVYNILFCPFDDKVPCGTVGSYNDQYGNRRLVVTELGTNRQDLEFQKLSYASTSAHSTAS